MKSLKQLFLVFLLVVSIASHSFSQEIPASKPEDVGMSTERLQRLNTVLEAYATDKKMAGSVIMISRHGKVVWTTAFGKRDVEANAPMQTDAIFRIASQTKALTSVAIMILQEEGKLLIGDPVEKYIPEFKESTVAEPKEGGGYNIVKAKRAITLRDLLTHTAGIGYGYGLAMDKWKEANQLGWYFADREEPIGTTVARMAKLPMESQPGEKFVYGYSTDILGAVVEKASGKTLSEFLTSRIFEPLGMKDTYFYLPKEKAGRLAAVYGLYPDKGLQRGPDHGTMSGQGDYVDGPSKSYSGGAGLLSTSMDYTRFLQMMLNGGVLNGKRILSPNTVALMTTNHIGKIATNGAGFGLGFSVCTDLGERGTPGSVGEYGWGGAYGSTYWVDPKEDLVVVYFKQLTPTNNLDDHGKLRALVYQSILSK